MTFALGPRAAQAGYRILSYDSLDSTSSEAMRLARAGECGPLWIATRRQTAGRGRRGREWISGEGNLTASLLFADAIAPAVAAMLGFAASLAVLQTCRELAPGVAFTLKWPNDVLANGGKVAGLLLESEEQHGQLAVAVGFGINLANAPAGMAFPAVSLASFGHPVPAESAFARLSDCHLDFAALWDRGRGFHNIRRLWLDHAQGIGQPISIRAGSRADTGTFETLDEEGRLVLRLSDGATRAVSAGDVYFGDAASAGATS
jgi:BirA family biotin operon repressor/biotin-[acetyl-CoA-carboxylase] ligase